MNYQKFCWISWEAKRVFFFKKKKLIEIDNKIDSVLEQLEISNQRYGQVLDSFSKIENRLSQIEADVENNRWIVPQIINEMETSIIEEITNLRASLKMLEVTVGELSEKNVDYIIMRIQSILAEINLMKDDLTKSQKESIVALNEKIGQSCNTLHQLINSNGIVNREKMEKVTCELDNKLEMMDSSLRILLLNSVMDQIEV